MKVVLLGTDPVCAGLAGALGATCVAESELGSVADGSGVLVPFAYFRSREGVLAGIVHRHGKLRFALLSASAGARIAAASLGVPCIALPAKPDDVTRAFSAQAPQDQRPSGTRTVLVADDSPLALKALARPLVEAGYEVIEATDGAEAIGVIGSRRIDLVVTDVQMPRATGYDVCRAVRSNATTASLPVIIQSSLAEGKDIEKGFEVGANDYIVKPVNVEEFLSKVANIFAGLSMRGREHILAVDDSQIVRGLRAQGFDIEVGVDGEDGFKRASARVPDLIISDYDMPEMTGFEMVAALRKEARTRDVPVIMLTARDTQIDRAKTTAVGANAYLTKPFNVNDLVAVVERIFAEVRLRREQDAMKMYLSEGAKRQAKAHAKAGTRDLKGEEKVVSILFSDIKGFTTKSDKMSPNEVVTMLNAYFDVMTAVLAEEEAIIDKFIGDAIMALFEGEETGLRACRAALAMQRAHARVNEGRAEPIVTRIGINTGKVIMGEIGSVTVRREYTVIGDTVNRAQRFESNAPPGGVLISASTYELVKDVARVEETTLALKGIAEPVKAFRLLDIHSSASVK